MYFNKFVLHLGTCCFFFRICLNVVFRCFMCHSGKFSAFCLRFSFAKTESRTDENTTFLGCASLTVDAKYPEFYESLLFCSFHKCYSFLLLEIPLLRHF